MTQALSVNEFATLAQGFQFASYDERTEIAKQLNQQGVATIESMLGYFEKTANAKDRESCYEIIQCINWEHRRERSETASLLSRTVREAPDEDFAIFALITLAWLHPDRAICTELLPLLFDERLEIRRTAIRFFADMWDERAVPYLEILLDDPVDSIQHESMEALECLSEHMASAELALERWEKRK